MYTFPFQEDTQEMKRNKIFSAKIPFVAMLIRIRGNIVIQRRRVATVCTEIIQE